MVLPGIVTHAAVALRCPVELADVDLEPPPDLLPDLRPEAVPEHELDGVAALVVVGRRVEKVSGHLADVLRSLKAVLCF